MAGGVGHTGGLTNPRPWRGRCRASYSNTGGPPLPRKRAPLQKKNIFLRLSSHANLASWAVMKSNSTYKGRTASARSNKVHSLQVDDKQLRLHLLVI